MTAAISAVTSELARGELRGTGGRGHDGVGAGVDGVATGRESSMAAKTASDELRDVLGLRRPAAQQQRLRSGS